MRSTLAEACFSSNPAQAPLGAVADVTREIHDVARIIENTNKSFANTYGRLAGNFPASGQSLQEDHASMGELDSLREAVERIRRAVNENSDFVGRFGAL